MIEFVGTLLIMVYATFVLPCLITPYVTVKMNRLLPLAVVE